MKLLIFFILLITAQSHTVFADGLNTVQAQRFMTDSGLDDLVDSLPDAMAQQLDLNRLMTINGMTHEQAKQAVRRAIKQVDGHAISLAYLTEIPSVASLSLAFDFLSSPLGQRISAEERAANTPDGQLKMQAYAMEMTKTPPSGSRAGLIKKLSVALNADQVILEIMKGTFFSILDVANAINPELSKTLKPTIESEWKNMKPSLRDQLARFMVMNSHYSYRNLQDEDLKQYIIFLNTPSGKAYWHTGLVIIDLYLKSFVAELIKSMTVKN